MRTTTVLACVSLEEANIRSVIAHLPAGGLLTAGEMQVLAQVCGGYSAKQIARVRGTSARTVEKQKQTAMAKLRLRSVLELAAAVGRGDSACWRCDHRG
ncbi:LuxR C-terminal-related transcriptional regulator [Roseateles chitinivorans]|uniref:LuxR C-terminal-related transcriptional regulator n=1 Tax=Roseateles chitinivorans TaxID=2917965 RepID=UPI003D66B9A6